MATAWKTVRVFISSTFRDMHAERDHLVRVVFPESRATGRCGYSPVCYRASALGAVISCPHCGESVKLNPFTINADWRPIAAAWKATANDE